MPPVPTNNNAYHHSSPHCPGETQASLVRVRTAIMPKLAGLKKCFWPTLKTNLLAMAANPAKAMVGQ